MSDYGYYVLVDKVPVQMPAGTDAMEWAEAFDGSKRRVRVTEVHATHPETQERIKARVSTVFLGLDHGFGGPTRLFETMIFGVPASFFDGEYQVRCEHYAEALVMHRQAVDELSVQFARHDWQNISLFEVEGTLENP